MAMNPMDMFRIAMQAAQTAPVPPELLEFTTTPNMPAGAGPMAAPAGMVPENTPMGVPYMPPTTQTPNVPQGTPTFAQAIPASAGGFEMPQAGMDPAQLQMLMNMLGGQQQMPGALNPQQPASQGSARAFGQNKQLSSAGLQPQKPDDSVQSLIALLFGGGMQ
jgi:hypothetical protein